MEKIENRQKSCTVKILKGIERNATCRKPKRIRYGLNVRIHKNSSSFLTTKFILNESL